MKRFDEEEEQAVLEVLRGQSLSEYFRNTRGGPKVQEFEETVAKYHGRRYAVACSNGTSALHIALLSAGVSGPDKKVVVPALSFIATGTCVLMAGAKPVFLDVNPKTYNLEATYLIYSIQKFDAVVYVNLLGNPANLIEIREAAGFHNAVLIEDHAQSLGSLFAPDKPCGRGGDISTLSFQQTKLCVTGEGGMVLTDSEEYAEKAVQLRSHGCQYQDSPFVCYNYRMDEIHAAIGLVQFRKLPKILEQQRRNAEYFLGRLPEYVKPQRVLPHATPNHYIIGCTVPPSVDRDAIVAKLTEKGINRGEPGATVGKGYTQPMYVKPVFGGVTAYCPMAEMLCQQFLWFDIRPMDFDTFKSVADQTIEVLEEYEVS